MPCGYAVVLTFPPFQRSLTQRAERLVLERKEFHPSGLSESSDQWRS